MTLSVFLSGMKKVVSSLSLVRGNAKLEMEKGKKVRGESKEKVLRRVFLHLRKCLSKGGRSVLDCLPWRTGIYAGRHEKKGTFSLLRNVKKSVLCSNFGLLLLFLKGSLRKRRQSIRI